MSSAESPLQAVLFDLDGTLVDSAPDLIAAVNRLRRTLGLPAAESPPLRAVAGRGAVAILKAGLPEIAEADREAFRAGFLDDYQAHCWEQSRIFEGIPALLERIEAAGLSWGIVTNKLQRLAAPVIEQAGWQGQSGCLIAGDSTPNPKPAPDPVLAACEALGVEPQKTLFVGDDRRDIQAGQSAACITIAAHWGYIPVGESAADWRADFNFASPDELLRWLSPRIDNTPGVAV